MNSSGLFLCTSFNQVDRRSNERLFALMRIVFPLSPVVFHPTNVIAPVRKWIYGFCCCLVLLNNVWGLASWRRNDVKFFEKRFLKLNLLCSKQNNHSFLLSAIQRPVCEMNLWKCQGNELFIVFAKHLKDTRVVLYVHGLRWISMLFESQRCKKCT